MECRQCGAKLPSEADFCPVCGTAVRGEAAEASAQDCAAVQEESGTGCGRKRKEAAVPAVWSSGI